VVDVVINATVAIKLFSITIQSNMIFPTNIHSYLVVCETLLTIGERREGRERGGVGEGKSEREERGRDENRKGTNTERKEKKGGGGRDIRRKYY
jgi:hypothetical protein